MTRINQRSPVERITAHLSTGGLFNPELADHAAVTDLLIDCRAELERLKKIERSYLERSILIDELRSTIERQRGAMQIVAPALNRAKGRIQGLSSTIFGESSKDTCMYVDSAISACTYSERGAEMSNTRPDDGEHDPIYVPPMLRDGEPPNEEIEQLKLMDDLNRAKLAKLQRQLRDSYAVVPFRRK